MIGLIRYYIARKICFETASNILKVFLQNRGANNLNEKGILELFELQERIYQEGKRRSYWE